MVRAQGDKVLDECKGLPECRGTFLVGRVYPQPRVRLQNGGHSLPALVQADGDRHQ